MCKRVSGNVVDEIHKNKFLINGQQFALTSNPILNGTKIWRKQTLINCCCENSATENRSIPNLSHILAKFLYKHNSCIWDELGGNKTRLQKLVKKYQQIHKKYFYIAINRRWFTFDVCGKFKRPHLIETDIAFFCCDIHTKRSVTLPSACDIRWAFVEQPKSHIRWIWTNL